MKQIIVLLGVILPLFFSCSKKESLSLEEVQAQKQSLLEEAQTLRPKEGDDLLALAQTQVKIYEVFATQIPTLIQKEKEILIQTASADQVKEIETEALCDLLATTIRANQAAQERLAIFQLLPKDSGPFYQQEKEWLAAHPPLGDAMNAFKKEYENSIYLKDAIKLYNSKYN